MSRPTKTKAEKKTVLTCQCPGALAVFIAGDFNDWNVEATPMKKGRGDKWSVSLALPPGRYEYKFMVDGVWCCEPGCTGETSCPRCVVNEFGTMNRYVEVGE